MSIRDRNSSRAKMCYLMWGKSKISISCLMSWEKKFGVVKSHGNLELILEIPKVFVYKMPFSPKEPDTIYQILNLH